MKKKNGSVSRASNFVIRYLKRNVRSRLVVTMIMKIAVMAATREN